MKKYIGVALVAVLIGISVWTFVMKPEEATKQEKAAETEIETGSNQPSRAVVATDFTLPMLNGESFTLSETRGKMTIINFWASWCGPCKKEAPHLQEFYEEYSDRVEIVAVNLTNRDKVKDAEAFVEEYGLTFPILLDETGEIGTMYGAFAIPTTIFLNERGEILHEYRGPMEKKFMVDLLEL